MDDEKLKRLLQEEMQRDADNIMKEVNSDPRMKDVVAPEIIREKLFAQIREYEEQKAHTQLSEEDKELIRLGKKYKKNRKKGKFLILIAAVVGAMGVGVVSMGGPKRIWTEVEGMIAGKEQTYTDTDGERTGETITISEEEAYQQVEDAFGVFPVRLDYMPDNMKYVEFSLAKEIQNAQCIYEGKKGEVVIYQMQPNHRLNSWGGDMDDKFLEEYTKEVRGVNVEVKRYQVEETKGEKWEVKFEFREVQYSLLISGVKESEVEKIVENLHLYS